MQWKIGRFHKKPAKFVANPSANGYNSKKKLKNMDLRYGKERYKGMQSETIVLMFDIIILILGTYALYAAVRMKKTGIPSAILIPAQEQPRIRNAEGFCQKMYQPTLVFGSAVCLYGIADLSNQFVLKQPVVDLLSTACFLIAIVWYVKKLRQVKEEHL